MENSLPSSDLVEAASQPRVYIETSVVSFLTAWPSRDTATAEMQQYTHGWWDTHRDHFELFVSNLVYTEARDGDAVAAQERLIVLDQLNMLQSNAEAQSLASELIRAAALPAKADDDAAHVAIAAVFGMDYLLSWNLRHMSNPHMRPRIEAVCAAGGYRAPRIRTPKELMEERP